MFAVERVSMSDHPSPSRQQPHEPATLLLTFTQAADLALGGEQVAGYRCLFGGLERAQEAADDGEPWRAEFVALYRIALDCYREAWGIKPE